MRPYLDISGDSGISAYELRPDAILVLFKTGNVYTYTYKSAGKVAVEEMKRLAEQGHGLATYINQNDPPYASKRQLPLVRP